MSRQLRDSDFGVRDRDIEVPRPTRDWGRGVPRRRRGGPETLTKSLQTEPRHLKTCLKIASSRDTCLEDYITAIFERECKLEISVIKLWRFVSLTASCITSSHMAPWTILCIGHRMFRRLQSCIQIKTHRHQHDLRMGVDK